MPKTILFDSKPASLQSNRSSSAIYNVAPAHGSSLGPSHSRTSSLVTESSAPKSPVVGGFTRIRTRGNSISSMPNIDEHAQIQAKAQARARESTDLANICLDCMFGNLAMNYRGNSNKIHIVPLDTKHPDVSLLSTSAQDPTSSFGRTDGLRRRSNLAKSFTPANFSSDPPAPHVRDSLSKEPKRRTIFITRMFSVTMPDDSVGSTSQSPLAQSSGFPFPQTSTKSATTKPTHPSHIRKMPMYAITTILHLPVSHISSSMRPSSRNANAKSSSSGPYLSTSAPGQDSLASSLDSDRRAGWAFIDANLGMDSLLSSSLYSDVDDRVDVIGQHWDVIMRALTSIQYVVQARILEHFKSMEDVGPTMTQQHRSQSSRTSLREVGARKPLRLPPNALMHDKDIQVAAESTGHRVVSGMRIPRVATGQGKWGVWREEARWLGRWAGRREQNFFFYTLLTAFLGSHTDWLNALGPRWARKRHREQYRATMGEAMTLSHRTVIVSPDKMAARRLIFLLVAFMPSNAPLPNENFMSMRPSTSASLRAYSQSPPSNVPPSRKQSLRRQINRRPKDKQSISKLQSPVPNVPGLLSSSNDAVVELTGEPIGAIRPSGHSRRSSTHSIRTGLAMTSMSEEPIGTKNSIPTTSAAMSQNTVPVAHFTLPRTKSFAQTTKQRPESSDSVASANLINTLQRNNTGRTSLTSDDSSSTSRWSGFMNFWGGRRSSSTEQSDFFQSTDDGLGYRGQERPRSQLEHMVQELSMDRVFEHDAYEVPVTNVQNPGGASAKPFATSGTSGLEASAALPIPERSRAFDAPLKLSVNEKDGVIDVDIPLPDFGAPLQSPLFGGYGASSQHGSSFGESSVLSMPYWEPEQPVNAAGWLSQFHADFVIQAIKPYRDLEKDIKDAMGAEPTPTNSAHTPSLDSGPQERWVDVCSTVIADTSSFTIKRISLRRLVRMIPTPTYQPSAMTPGAAGGHPARSQYGNPYIAAATTAPMLTEVHLAQEFVEETIMDFDATLADSVDRVLAQSGEITRVSSAQSSRSSSRRGRRDTRTDSDAPPHVEVAQNDCKGVIFDALESIVKDVTAGRDGKFEPKDSDQPSTSTTHMNVSADSSLREGVRRWLAEVE